MRARVCNEGWGRKKRETTRESVQQRVQFTKFLPMIVYLAFSSGIHVSIAMPLTRKEGRVQFVPSRMFDRLLYNRRGEERKGERETEGIGGSE